MRFQQKKRKCRISLFMCMGIGCNAVGVVGCRIIDSKRERLIAMLTNAFVPCNGKFPTLLALLSMFFVISDGWGESCLTAVLLSLLVFVSILTTFLCSAFLSSTVLKGEPSSFTLELPPYRTPQIGKIVLRSLLDRTVFVLGRAVLVAAPAGLLIWIFANLQVGNVTVLQFLADLLDPIGGFFGMDGVILLGFILAFPANEIAVPIMLMIYDAGKELSGYGSFMELRELLLTNGWTRWTAACVLIFMLFHFPCSTTLLTIRKESGSWKWVLAGLALPTVVGLFLCFVIACFSEIFAI